MIIRIPVVVAVVIKKLLISLLIFAVELMLKRVLTIITIMVGISLLLDLGKHIL